MGKKQPLVELGNFISTNEYVPFIHNLQESLALAQEFEKKLAFSEDGMRELKKYCGIDDSFRVTISRELSESSIQMYGTNILVQVWLKLNIYDTDNKLISKGETFYFDVQNGKISIMDLVTEEQPEGY